ncbi:helix-turn-helix domain-containing protein [Cryptosporangium arvum]|uniref:DNA-binding domain-containing protein, AraC-type n=1 Tax=Cryptosporangium arvum DSM 44712 TaxID=927661 RepID=A0A010YYQ4_9ACTN|nr:helix-turn-helix transcriptional regulator [Cryptosporangium arvum]EXG80353.1 DNA-binding domain-containing protein, AraC-type [Cryptosporangium arvum DSM 44712]
MHAPTTTTEIVLSVCCTGRPELVVLGPRTRALYYEPNGNPVAPRFRLTAGQARAAFGMPVTEFTDQVVPLPSADAGQLAERWLAAPSRPGAVLEPYLAAAAPAADRETRWVDAAAARLAGGTPIAAVADDLGVSERHLRNRFAAAVGVSPKHYARIQRVRRVLDEIGSAPFAQLAAQAGYYDQSHLGREFRQLMGVSPAAFAAGRRPAPRTCATTKAS